jgi:hypothetical protein
VVLVVVGVLAVAGVLVVGVLVAVGVLVVAGVLVAGVLVAGVLVAAGVFVFPVFPLGSDGDGDTEPSPPALPPEPSAPSPGTELLVVVVGGVVVVVLDGGEPLLSACWTNPNLGAVRACGVWKAINASTPTATASDTSSVFLSQRLEVTPLASPAALALTTRSILIAPPPSL